MADDLKNRGAQDRARVNVNEDHEVRYWTQKMGRVEGTTRRGSQKGGRVCRCGRAGTG